MKNTSSHDSFEELFPRAATYAAWRSAPFLSEMREGEAPDYAGSFLWSERHLQCVWFDSRFRPRRIPLPGGGELEVVDPGRWNLGAGPDFMDARLRILPEGRELRGDVEVHVRPSSWDAHRHGGDAAYAHVVAHVTWFAAPPARTLPRQVLNVPLGNILSRTAGLSLDDLDVDAYPYAAQLETARPCTDFFRRDPDAALRVLAAAGEYRIQQKANRLAACVREGVSIDEVLYRELMAALGYRANQRPFRILAELVPRSRLAVLSREAALAALAGAGGVLPDPECVADAEAGLLARRLWDLHWRQAEDVRLPEGIEWQTANLRPQNAPLRRLAAAASLFSREAVPLDELSARLAREDGSRWLSVAVDGLMDRCDWSFFRHRLSFRHPPSETSCALLGRGRATAMVVNVLLPLAAVRGEFPSHALLHLPSEDLSTPMRHAANALLGRDHNSALYAEDGLLQQGLLQIYRDFCSAEGCADCRLVSALASQLGRR